MKALILAGGKGRRLMPYTTIIPKPLMPIGNKAILEIIVQQLKYHGFDDIILSIGYLGELMMAFFNNGNKYGVKIDYVKEDEPLGTAGPLSLVNDQINGPFLMMNGDILTDLNYSELIDYHKRKKGILTVALNKRKVNIEFGVTQVDESNRIINYIEKPTFNNMVSMGIYVFEKRILDYIEPNQYLDFPDLVKKLIENDEIVNGYPFEGYWLDIGRHDDYEKANQEVDKIYDQLFKFRKKIEVNEF